MKAIKKDRRMEGRKKREERTRKKEADGKKERERETLGVQFLSGPCPLPTPS